ncbi:MAG: peptide ABC transporter substrate-binding protein [Oscillochloris sp.]|nr:peptide ABC transporter substrate-binding protein [Oscillochloris sp.]
MPTFSRHSATYLLLGLLLSLAACSSTTVPPIRETIFVTAAPQIIRETVVVTPTPDSTAEAQAVMGREAFTTPHPILSNPKVRRAIAYCTNRPALIAAVYSFLSEEQQQGLLIETNVPRGHWAATAEGIATYPFNPQQGGALLDEAGWALAEGDTIRTNADKEPLALRFTTSDSQFRQTWSALFIQQMANCGIQIVPTYAPSSWWFGASTGLHRRSFELGAYAWVSEPDPKGRTLYACNQIPFASNNWEGQNYMGWCNQAANQAILTATNTLDRKERIKQYAIFQREFTRDMVSLPLFSYIEVVAASQRVKGLSPNPTESYAADLDNWRLSEGDTLVIGSSQEPVTLWESSGRIAPRHIAFLLDLVPSTTDNYDYQAHDLRQLPTLENGGATNSNVEVRAGDQVFSAEGEIVELSPGVNVVDAEGETITYESGSITMKQLAATFAYTSGITWADGEPLRRADLELGLKIDCDPELGAQNLALCESKARVDFLSDTSYRITYLPGVQWPNYSAYTLFQPYPAHQLLSDGRKLADVPTREWQSLPEVTSDPLSAGPYVLERWQKGESMTFRANPHYYKGTPKIKQVVITFIRDPTQAVDQLLAGQIDVLDSEALGSGPEMQRVLEAAAQGHIQAFLMTSPTWEHIDINLFER